MLRWEPSRLSVAEDSGAEGVRDGAVLIAMLSLHTLPTEEVREGRWQASRFGILMSE